uniref:NADH dehydrogenase subunit 4 n=1 Tax=Panagrolaimus davidi TaxID=227884 RepID=A0A914R6Y0_9BILA
MISWLIAPLYFFVVLTQSKLLGSFKWLLFNYSLWGFFLTTFMGLVKPIFLTPAFAVIHIGIFQNIGSYLSTFALIAILVAIGTTCMGGMVSTLTYRYLMVFPSILKD